MIIVDTHCHLDFDAYEQDREIVLQRSRQAGIEKIVVPGIEINNCGTILKLCDTYPDIYAAVGVHPNSALSWNEQSFSELEDLARHPKVVAIGEIGLDYYRDKAPRDTQKLILTHHLSLAEKLDLPVIIHSRQAEVETLNILTDWVSHRNPTEHPPGVFHSYMGDEATAFDAVRLGFFIGINGAVTFQNAKKLHHLVTVLPLSSIVIETDAPFLAPHPNRGKRNEPAYVLLVAEYIASLKNLPVNIVAESTTANAEQLFKWS